MFADLLVNAPLLLAAAFFAGVLNALAGGGSFLTLPALILAGLPPVAANATGTVALLPGYASSTFATREDMRFDKGLSLPVLLLASLIGGAVGAALLVWLPNETFDVVIPWLLLLATAAFAFGPLLLKQKPHQQAGVMTTLVTLLAVTIYGGYFNGGLGILLLAAFSLLGFTAFNAANALKNLVSLLLTLVAVVVYVWGGAVHWPEAIIMMVAATAGGYIGSRITRRIPANYVRYAVIAIGAVMTGLFFVY